MYENELTGTKLADIDKVGVEKAKEPGYVYIGRENEKRGLTESPLANPYRLSDGYTRREAVEEYVAHFYEEYRSRSQFATYVGLTEGKTLLCFCQPKLCHGHAIILHHTHKTRLLTDPHKSVDIDKLEERVRASVKQLAETKA
jgi:hypothetical protein